MIRSNIQLKAWEGRGSRKRLRECVKVRGNETLDRIFEQKDHRVVALFTHSGIRCNGPCAAKAFC